MILEGLERLGVSFDTDYQRLAIIDWVVDRTLRFGLYTLLTWRIEIGVGIKPNIYLP